MQLTITRAVELVSRAAGKIKEAHVWCGRTIKPVGEEVLPEQPVPDGFNWETWLDLLPIEHIIKDTGKVEI